MAFHSSFGNRRGGFAPRRGRGGTHTFVSRPVLKPDTEKHPLGQLLTTFNVSDLELHGGDYPEGSTITDCDYVASYSWTNSRSPTILVPGKPALWTPLQQPQRLQEDSGQYFRDPNSARFPTFPTEPAVRALFDTTPGLPTDDVDVFACGSTLGNLLRFVRSIDKPFRFQIEVIGNTVFFVRKENDPRETIDGIHGYGHTFPEAYTTWEKDVKGSESHQRICQYEFSRLKCVVRFECDGYLSQSPKKAGSSSASPDQGVALDDLLKSMETATVGNALSDAAKPLTVKPSGTVVPQHTIFDLKTRSGRYKKEIDMDDIYPQLWIKQIPNFIIAYHDGAGTFSDIRVQNVQSGIRAWEKQNNVAIQRLAVLLRKIVDVSRQDGTGLLEAYCPSVGRLEIRRQYEEGVHALPSELREKWEGTDKGLDLSNDGWDVKDRRWEDDYATRFENDSDSEPDYTACSADDCGYCGKCTY